MGVVDVELGGEYLLKPVPYGGTLFVCWA